MEHLVFHVRGEVIPRELDLERHCCLIFSAPKITSQRQYPLRESTDLRCEIATLFHSMHSEQRFHACPHQAQPSGGRQRSPHLTATTVALLASQALKKGFQVRGQVFEPRAFGGDRIPGGFRAHTEMGAHFQWDTAIQ